jgi:DNA-binding CsgD family transcriptional regulator
MALPEAQEDSPDLASGYRLRSKQDVAQSFQLRWSGQKLDIPPGTEFSIGRAPECLLRLDSNLVSRHHARITHGEDGPFIEDLGSLNGVLINQQQIYSPTKLVHGDVICIGVEVVEFVNVDAIERTAHLSTLRTEPYHRGDSTEASPPTSFVPPLEVLSPRERQVLELVVQGYTPREMSDTLNLSLKTVEAHRRRISDKLDCRTRAELVTYAICAGLLRGT